MTLFEHGYALMIGVGADLPCTVSDAKDIAAVLRDPSRAAYRGDHVLELTGEQASRAGVLGAFEALRSMTSGDPEATILLLYSGHGARIGPSADLTKYYLLTHGYDLQKPDETCVSDTEFTSAIEALHSRKLLVLLDCCHAAGIPVAKALGSPEATAALPEATLKALEKGTGTLIVASCRKEQKSYTGERNSVFTAAVLKALEQGGASGEDARVFQVLDYVTKTVPIFNPKQEPLVVKAENLSNFTICRGAWSATPAPVPGQGSPKSPEKPKLAPWMADSIRQKIAAYLPGVQDKRDKIKRLREEIEETADPAAKIAIEKKIARTERELESDEAKLAQWQSELDEG